MYDKYFEMLTKEPTTYLIISCGFGVIGLWGAISLLVFISWENPKTWIAKILHSNGIKYSEHKRLKVTYVLYSFISVLSSSVLFSLKEGAVYSYISASIFMLNIFLLFLLFIVDAGKQKIIYEDEKEIPWDDPRKVFGEMPKFDEIDEK